MFGKNLQRTYKYIMYATKTPSLKINHSDLKCKSGCGFYGNAQWQGYCSKCHREQRRREEKASTSIAHREHQILERQPKTSPSAVTAFSKFEEKKLRQFDSLKKNKLLKLNVFRKASNAKDVQNEREKYHIAQSSAIQQNAYEKQRKDFYTCFPNLENVKIERDTAKFIQLMYTSIAKQSHSKSVDELSEMSQSFYQVFAKHMDSKELYSNIDAETRELLLDFVEKYAMTYLHGLLFSPLNSDDEKKDSQICSRIRQLCWVSPQHLDCGIDQSNVRVRDLLYSAISELVAMDSVLSPGGKLLHVVGCCRGVVEVVTAASGKPASADELLPALIFTVLKANPPRLISNINFITRYCNAARLMTGEGGYYFTNLCCAVSFIENLTPESLSMTKEDFDSYMSLPAVVGGGSWVAALSLCEGLHELQDQIKRLQELQRKSIMIENEGKKLVEDTESFKENIFKKVADVLERTPLDFSKRHTAENTTAENKVKEDLFIESFSNDTASSSTRRENIPILTATNENSEIDLLTDDNPLPQTQVKPLHPVSLINLSVELDNPPISTIKTIGSNEFLSPSPIFDFASFDNQSLDDLATPDEFASEHFLHGLTNVNYDIDLSDLSAENSAAEDVPANNEKVKKVSRDPFSPDGIRCPEIEDAIRSPRRPESLRPTAATPDFSAAGKEVANTSILDSTDSPLSECFLPSPIKPVTASPVMK